MANESTLPHTDFTKRGYMCLGHNQYMRWRLRLNISEGNDFFILVEETSRHFTSHNATKDASLGHFSFSG